MQPLEKITQERVAELLANSSRFGKAKLQGLVQLSGDASSREYYRIELSSGGGKANRPETIIVMALKGGLGPVGGGRVGLSQDDAFVQIGTWLYKEGFPVPEILLDRRDCAVLAVEDVGDISLRKALSRDLTEAEEQWLEENGSKDTQKLFFAALSSLIALRSVQLPETSVVRERVLNFEHHRSKIDEISRFILSKRGAKRSELEVVSELFDGACESICSHPKVTTHYDFVAHNIFIVPNQQIKWLDFQDMCIDSVGRDVVSLLNDRDVDQLLGPLRQRQLLIELAKLGQLPSQFRRVYYEYLFYWDCRVSGRFAILSEERGKPTYRQWIPGTVRRLAQSSLVLLGEFPRMGDFVEIVSNYLPEFKESLGGRAELLFEDGIV